MAVGTAVTKGMGALVVLEKSTGQGASLGADLDIGEGRGGWRLLRECERRHS